MKRAGVMVAVAAAACGSGHAATPGANVCDALAIAAATSKELRDQADGQFASADHAMAKWTKWEKKEIPAEQDAAGDYSGAGTRARTYQAAGFAMCESTVLVHGQMSELARTMDVDVSAPATHL